MAEDDPIEEIPETVTGATASVGDNLAERVGILEQTIGTMAADIAALKPIAAVEAAPEGANAALEPTVESAPAPQGVSSNNERESGNPMRSFHNIFG